MIQKLKYLQFEVFVVILYLLIPTVLILLGLFLFPYPPSDIERQLVNIPLFGGLFLLTIGYILRKKVIAHKIKMIGWLLFSFFWATKINELYFGEEGDFVNAALVIAGIFLLIYLAYQEWLSETSMKDVSCLDWIAGVAAISGLLYFIIDLTPLANWLIELVAEQSAGVLNLFIGDVTSEADIIFYKGTYVTNIIFSCTAIQSIVIFVGGILPLGTVTWRRRMTGLFITVAPIYFLNLIRNALIIYLIKDDPDFFFMAHNVIGKGLSLIALIILLLIVSKLIPELFDELLCLTDLPKRKGPLETFFTKKGTR